MVLTPALLSPLDQYQPLGRDQPGGPIPQKLGYLCSRHGLGVEIPLPVAAAHFPQPLRLPNGLHPLSRDLEVQAAPEAHHCRNNGIIILVLLNVADKGLVNLEVIDRELLEMSKRGIARPEII